MTTTNHHHADQTALDPVRLRAALEAAQRYYSSHLHDSPAQAEVRRRGIPESTLAFGYAPPGWSTTTDALRRDGFGDDVLVGAGIARRASSGTLVDTLRDRLTVPVRDHAGVIAFTARTLGSDGEPKWLNTPGTSLWHKRANLLTDDRGLDPDPTAMPILAEGALDVAALAHSTDRMGAYAAAPCGTALTKEQVSALYAAHPRAPICLALDSDEAGRNAAVRAWDVLTRHPDFGQRQLLAVSLPDGDDPADLVARGESAGLRRRVIRARPLAELVADHRTTGIHAHDNTLRAVRAAQALIADDWDRLHPSSRQHYTRHLAARLGLDLRDVVPLVADHIARPVETAFRALDRATASLTPTRAEQRPPPAGAERTTAQRR